MSEIIEILGSSKNKKWAPFVGEETDNLLRSKNFSNPDGTLSLAGEKILNETYRIMEVCGNPNSKNNIETGIVIGYVQSGKTLSFTVLTTLARDNDYQIVIIIAGTSMPLFTQSTNRLRRDLRLDTRFDRRWTLISNPKEVEDKEAIQTVLAQWANPNFPNEKCRTLLITVMKQKDHLNNLAGIFDGMNLDGVSTLIIDDEADQASLNTNAKKAARQGKDLNELTENELSTIYRRITKLKSLFSHHTFIQYTASPQANLFINILDRLSPNFIKLLTPGDDYTGGVDFFKENPFLVAEIPPSDLSTPNNPLPNPPDSLIKALRIFFLGVVAGEISQDQKNRSMLVHPSRLQGEQYLFTEWIRSITNSWWRLLSSNDNDEKESLLEDFRESYDDLKRTAPNIPEFEKLIGLNLINAIQYIPIVEVNARRGETPQINWQNTYSWILVGGQSMDRGFTVEGLTVTYMPRNPGVGNVDTILQRARFFGYKKSYLGYCRVFLDQLTIDAYNAIIEHEENVREQLEDFDINNKHLDKWDREVVLSQMLKLTRANILYDQINRDIFGNEWFRIKAPHDTEEYIATNRTAIFEYVYAKRNAFSVTDGHPKRTEDQKHLVTKVSLQDCLTNLLNKLKFTRESDSVAYSSLRGIFSRHLKNNPEEECLIYLISAKKIENLDHEDSWTRRTRQLVRKSDEIQQIFQGPQPTTKSAKYNIGDVYPGDSSIKNKDIVSIQIHLLNLRNTSFVSVPTLAIWVPEHMSTDIARQPSNTA